MTTRARWASGARSPEAPTDPCQGMTGCTPRSSSSHSRSAEQRAHAGLAGGQHRRPQQQHPAHDRAGQRLAHAGGMAAHQVALQLADGVGVDAHLGQRPEPGVDPVDAGRVVARLRRSTR